MLGVVLGALVAGASVALGIAVGIALTAALGAVFVILLGKSPHAKYVPISAVDLCTLMAVFPLASIVAMSALITVTLLPLTTLCNGKMTLPGFGHEPVWICAGSVAPVGSP